MLMKGVDAPYLNNYWDYPSKGPHAPPLEYSDKIDHLPLFSSLDQVLTRACMGKLHFAKSIHPEYVRVDPNGDVVSKSGNNYVVSKVPSPFGKCASIDMGGAVPANFEIGGGGPGSVEMRGKLYQQSGPHYLGRILKDGSWCMEPSAFEARDLKVYDVQDPDTLVETHVR